MKIVVKHPNCFKYTSYIKTNLHNKTARSNTNALPQYKQIKYLINNLKTL